MSASQKTAAMSMDFVARFGMKDREWYISTDNSEPWIPLKRFLRNLEIEYQNGSDLYSHATSSERPTQ